MPFTVGVASDYLHLQSRLKQYLVGDPSVENEVTNVANVGDGYIRQMNANPSAVVETWTLTCTAGGPAATFSVVGSVTGNDGNATSTHDADNVSTYLFLGTRIHFKIIDGPTDYSIGDEFTLDIVANDLAAISQEWTLLKQAPGIPIVDKPMNQDPAAGADKANEFYLKGPGLAGTDEVFVQMYSYYSEAGDYYNINFCGATGFDGADTLDEQPGFYAGGAMALWQFQIKYWFVADGRRFIVSTKISTSYMHAYCGLLLPYATPTEYPYPLYIGACLPPASGTRWSSESEDHRAYWEPETAGIYTIEGTWLAVQNKYDQNDTEVVVTTTVIWPYSSNYMWNTRQSPGDIYPMMPLVLTTSSNGGNVYGELPGGFWTPGFANASENVIVLGGTDYVVMQDVFRTGNQDYFALKLE